jgi:senataxin
MLCYTPVKQRDVLNSWQEQERLFKLESYERVDATLKAEEAEALVEAGSIMACNFRLSRNYFRLKPGEVYVYDRRFPYIHPISDLPVSHAVTVIGHGGQPRPPPAEGQVRHVHVQNSEGKRSGDDGFLRVARDSVRGLYRLTLPPPAAPSSPPPAAPAHD